MKLPRLRQHLIKLQCDITIIATDWFLCLFATVLPSEVGQLPFPLRLVPSLDRFTLLLCWEDGSQLRCFGEMQSAMRLWDALLHEGPKVLYRMALALLKMQEEVLLRQDNPGFVLHELKRAAHATHNRAALMKVRFARCIKWPRS